MKYENSILLNTDSYKVSMWKQYPPGTEYVYSYIESRGGDYDATLLFGIQAFVKEYLTTPITQEEIDYADMFWTAHGEPFNREGWQYILDKHAGKLPIVIKAAQEGLIIPTRNVLATVENTDPMCFWLTTWVETALLRAVWYGTTVATQSHSIRMIIKSYLVKSSDYDLEICNEKLKMATLNEKLAFVLHDFGARGVSSNESAMLGGMAHLATGAAGTDNANAIIGANRYYGAPIDATAFSIPAAEHSTITSWSRGGEIDAYRNMVKQFGKPGAILAVVSDSYDIYAACRMWGSAELKAEVIASGATVVIRPDSGDPLVVLPRMLKILAESFGCVENDKGYNVLNNVRILWGDGINEVSISSILRVVVDLCGWSADNIAFGMGGALLQIVNRDTLQFAMKASAVGIRVNNNAGGSTIEWRDVFKQPATDTSKASKRGRVSLYKSGDQYISGIEGTIPKSWSDQSLPWVEALECVYLNGELVRDMTFDSVRANSK